MSDYQRDFGKGEYQTANYKSHEDEPLGFWDKQKVTGRKSTLAGPPDGLAGPATAEFNFIFDDVRTFLDKVKLQSVDFFILY